MDCKLCHGKLKLNADLDYECTNCHAIFSGDNFELISKGNESSGTPSEAEEEQSYNQYEEVPDYDDSYDSDEEISSEEQSNFEEYREILQQYSDPDKNVLNFFGKEFMKEIVSDDESGVNITEEELEFREKVQKYSDNINDKLNFMKKNDHIKNGKEDVYKNTIYKGFVIAYKIIEENSNEGLNNLINSYFSLIFCEDISKNFSDRFLFRTWKLLDKKVKSVLYDNLQYLRENFSKLTASDTDNFFDSNFDRIYYNICSSIAEFGLNNKAVEYAKSMNLAFLYVLPDDVFDNNSLVDRVYQLYLTALRYKQCGCSVIDSIYANFFDETVSYIIRYNEINKGNAKFILKIINNLPGKIYEHRIVSYLRLVFSDCVPSRQFRTFDMNNWLPKELGQVEQMDPQFKNMKKGFFGNTIPEIQNLQTIYDNLYCYAADCSKIQDDVHDYDSFMDKIISGLNSINKCSDRNIVCYSLIYCCKPLAYCVIKQMHSILSLADTGIYVNSIETSNKLVKSNIFTKLQNLEIVGGERLFYLNYFYFIIARYLMDTIQDIEALRQEAIGNPRDYNKDYVVGIELVEVYLNMCLSLACKQLDEIKNNKFALDGIHDVASKNYMYLLDEVANCVEKFTFEDVNKIIEAIDKIIKFADENEISIE